MKRDYNRKIATLIHQSIKEGKAVNPNFINKIIDLVIEEEDLSKYLLEIEYAEGDGIWYNAINRIITIDIEYCFNFLEDEDLTPFSIYERELLVFLNITQCILHELVHVWQFKNSLIGKRTLENFLYRLHYQSDLNLMKEKNLISIIKSEKYKTLYKKYYYFAPTERVAEVYAYKNILEISKIFDLENIITFYMNKILEAYIFNYNKTNSPTIYYLKHTNFKNEAERISLLEKSLDYNTRLNLGLNLYQRELHKLVRKKTNLEEKLNM